MDTSPKTLAVDSLRFYIMLSIILSKNDSAESLKDKSLKEYVKEGAWWHNNNSKTIATYMQYAYESLPTEFLKQHSLEITGGKDEIRWLNRNC